MIECPAPATEQGAIGVGARARRVCDGVEWSGVEWTAVGEGVKEGVGDRGL